MKHHRFPFFLFFLGLAVLAALTLAACKGGEKTAVPAPAGESGGSPGRRIDR